MPDIALLVAQDLHLDVPRALDHLFQIALAVAEGGFRLAPALADLGLQLVLGQDRAHPPPAAAPGRLQHQGVTHRLGLGLDGGKVIAQHLGRGDDRHARRHRHAARAGLVAQGAHGFGARPDKGDPGPVAGIDEIGVL